MNRYYTETIPVDLARALKDKGMLLHKLPNTSVSECITEDVVIRMSNEPVPSPVMGLRKYALPTYAEVFDWLMSEKGVYISGFRRFNTWRWAYATEWRFRIELEDISQEEVNGYMVNGNTWYEAANTAIKKALTLI